MSVERAVGVAVLIGGAGLLYNEMNKPRIVAYNVTTYPGTSGNSGGPNMAGIFNFIGKLFSGAGAGSGQVAPTPFNPQPKGGGPAPTTQTGQSATGNPLLALIGSKEAPKGYAQVYGGSKLTPPKPITSMTVREVLAWQDASVARGSASSAAGRYQIIRGTLRGLVAKGAIGLDDLYSPANQDRLAQSLMDEQGYSKWASGSMTDEEFGQNLARVWASFPVFFHDKRGRAANGQSYYAGDGLNHALTDTETVLRALQSLKAWL